MQLTEDYIELIQKVEKFDHAAADFLQFRAEFLSDFRCIGDLSRAFNWSSTPQGDRYWRNLFHMINRSPKKRCEIFQPDYLRLIEEIRKINIEAAYYLENEAVYLPSFRSGSEIHNIFNSKETRQGRSYWLDIDWKVVQSRMRNKLEA